MIRITGGKWRGRSLHTPKVEKAGVRPTQAKLRQALFNSIQFLLPESHVLDLFAGPGTLGFEALSRGAQSATFVENFRGSLEPLFKNQSAFEVKECTTVLNHSVWELARESGRFRLGKSSAFRFDLIFADPPYGEDAENRLLSEVRWTEVLKPEGLLLIEWGLSGKKSATLPDSLPAQFLVKIREKIYGDSVLSTFQLKPQSNGTDR